MIVGRNEDCVSPRIPRSSSTLYYVDGDPNETVAPDAQKLELDEDHWVAFVLDRFGSVADAVAAFQDEVHLVSVQGGIGYSYAGTPKHLAIEDATGDSAIVEISEGEVAIFHGPEYRILTNPPSYEGFKSLLGPSDTYFDFAGHDLSAGQPVRVIERIDLYPASGWNGDVVPHLDELEGDIYDEPIS